MVFGQPRQDDLVQCLLANLPKDQVDHMLAQLQIDLTPPPALTASDIEALFAAGLTMNATWPIEMELKNRMRGLNSAALQTSIAVVCRNRITGSAASFKAVRREIEQAVQESIKCFWSYGFRGADLVVAC